MKTHFLNALSCVSWSRWTILKFLVPTLLLVLSASCESRMYLETRTFPETIRKTSSFINTTMAEKNGVGLSIALVDGEKIVWAQGFGWADKENSIPAGADTAYMLGSGSKTLSTVALLQLLEQGLVRLESPASDYLPEFQLAARFPNQMQEITVERLLNHHSGIPGDIYNSGFVEEAWNYWGCNLYIDWLLGYLSDEYPSYPPGKISVYSNTGFVLAGEIALRLGGQGNESFNEFMTRQLFLPLGMESTTFRALPGMAVGYIGGEPLPADMETNCVFGATGGAVTNVLDMGRFLSMLLTQGKTVFGDRILSPQTLALMGRGERTPLDLNSYSTPGLGLDTINDPVMSYAGRAWAKNGSTGHFNSFMEILPDKGLAVIVLTNSDTAQFAVYSIARECLKNAVEEKTGLTPSLPDYPDFFSVSNPALIAGTYVKKNGFDIVQDNLDGTLLWIQNAHTQNPVAKKLEYGQDFWSVEDAAHRIVFKLLSYMGEDHFVMIQVGSDGSELFESIFGGHVVLLLAEKLAPQPVGAAWLARAGRPWLIENYSFNDLGWDRPFLELVDNGGMLMVAQSENLQVIFPQNDQLAFVAGLANRNGSAVRVENDAAGEKMVFVGCKARSIDQVPIVTGGDMIAKDLDFHQVHWFGYNCLAPGGQVVFDVPGGQGGYILRLFDQDLDSPVARGVDRLTFNAAPGTYYLAVSRTPDAPGNYMLTVNP
ncbi:MAG: serine hydrolase domain-containing protein [Desulfatibacillaceae bacterium]|nr:serine hydrolase domain-containing protein [Desulfatibacillaceae bacterium]